jgi:hypothetical protein
MVRISCSLTREISDRRILADNGATHTIINEDWAHLVQDFTPLSGRVSGSTPGTLGVVVGEGYMIFWRQNSCIRRKHDDLYALHWPNMQRTALDGMET